MLKNSLSQKVLKNAIIVPFSKGENFGDKASGIYDEKACKISNYYSDELCTPANSLNKADKALIEGGGAL